MSGEPVAVFQRQEGEVIPGGSALFEKGTARWVRNYKHDRGGGVRRR
jgi:hypothetical protein